MHPDDAEAMSWKMDVRMGWISLCMWAGTAVKVYPSLTFFENVQSASAMVVIYVLVVAWPTFFLDSYLEWRILALSFLRVFLIALPFNFSTAVFDAIAPHVGTGKLAVVSNVFQLFMAIRIALLTFTSLGWRVPFRLHMVLQAVNVTIFAVFGLHPYCHSKLLSSPELQATATLVHKAMGYGATLFLPYVTVTVPQGEYEQMVAFVLFCWAILGWLLPTLLLLPKGTDPNNPNQQRQQQQRNPWHLLSQLLTWTSGKCIGALETCLYALQPPKPPQDEAAAAAAAAAAEAAAMGISSGQLQQQLQRQQQLQQEKAVLDRDGLVVSWLLWWWVVLLVAWRLACALAGPQQPLLLWTAKSP